jgi:bifunctional DNase/RNase
MIEVKVSGLGKYLSTGQWLLLLQGERTARHLAVVISRADARAIALRLAKNRSRRPLTHDLIQDLIGTLGGQVSCACIDHVLSDGRLCAQLVIVIKGRRLYVDCRPSDAVALALQASMPIYVDETIMAEKGMVLQDQQQSVTPEEKEKLAPFAEFINELDLDGL